MSFTKSGSKAILAAATVGAMLAITPHASALLSYDSPASGATFTHTFNSSPIASTLSQTGTLTPRSNPKTFKPTTTYPATPSYQFKQIHTITNPSAGGSTQATGSVAIVNNTTTVGAKVQAGTGVTQLNPKGEFDGPSSLKIDLDAYFNPDASGFGPGASGVASFNIGGTVGSAAGSSASFRVVLDFRDDNYYESYSTQGVGAATVSGDQMRSTIDITRIYKRPGTGVVFGANEFATAANGTFSALVSSSELLNIGITEGSGGILYYQRLRIVGYVEFQARNGFVTTVPLSASFTTADEEEDPGTTISFTREGGAGAAIGGVLALGVPEPATAALSMLSLGAVSLGLLRRRKA